MELVLLAWQVWEEKGEAESNWQGRKELDKNGAEKETKWKMNRELGGKEQTGEEKINRAHVLFRGHPLLPREHQSN